MLGTKVEEFPKTKLAVLCTLKYPIEIIKKYAILLFNFNLVLQHGFPASYSVIKAQQLHASANSYLVIFN